MSRNVIMIAAIVVIAGYFYMKSADKQQDIITQETSQQETLSQGESNSNDTEDRLLIENLFKEGIISKIDDLGNSPKVYVTADYERIENVDKEAMMKVLLKTFMANNPNVTSFTIYDEKSGDEIGTYDSNGFTRN